MSKATIKVGAIKAHLRSMQDTDTDAAVHAYPAFISCVFWSVSWNLDGYRPNRAAPQKIRVSRESTRKNLHMHLKRVELQASI